MGKQATIQSNEGLVKTNTYMRYLVSVSIFHSLSIAPSPQRFPSEFNKTTKSTIRMKITSLVGLAATLPAAFGAMHALYFTTHQPDWVSKTDSTMLASIPELFPNGLTVPAGGSPTDVILVDGEGQELNVLAGLVSSSSYPEQSAVIDLGSQKGVIQVNRISYESEGKAWETIGVLDQSLTRTS